ncbi:MAG: hypothetical protein M1834_000046 [Cirrosporium novae-zelandiae]|nr:MAG: hypothetical protein M1834_000046 [Cirrosporium novae-zelandiae]
MATGAYPSIPGAFVSLAPKLDHNTVGANSNIFRPPRTPSSKSSLHQSASSRGPSSYSTLSRKRHRHEFSLPESFGQTTNSTRWSNLNSTSAPASFAAATAPSPAPFVDTKYLLAGGLDTPTASAAASYDKDEPATHTDMGFRRGWEDYPSQSIQPQEMYAQNAPNPLISQRYSQQQAQLNEGHNGWGSALFQVFGGVAGKVWQFCRTGAFRGFHAGGGQAYSANGVPNGNHSLDQSIWSEVSEKCDSFRMERTSTPLPGQYPPEGIANDYMSRDYDTPMRPSKRIQREKGEAELKTSWVMVEDGVESSRDPSPSRVSTRKIPKYSTPVRRTHTHSRSLSSRAIRRPIVPSSRPSYPSQASSPALYSEKPSSFASPYSRGAKSSPMSEESQRYVAKAKKREHEEDASMRRLNAQLKAMIKEGREALGTKFEVFDEEMSDGEDPMEDEGFVDGDYTKTNSFRW